MFSKRSLFNCILITVMLAGLGACQPTPATTTTAPPDTPSHELAVQTETPIPSITEPIPPPANCRSSILKPTELIRAVHMGGNDGTNYEPENTLPVEYFEYLHNLNVNWVGIGVSMHYADSMDSTVERVYSGVTVPAFSDEFLRKLIRISHREGFCFYLSMVLESSEAEKAERPVARYQLGIPTEASNDESILPENWPWALDYPDHEKFVSQFWESYTAQAVHYGQLAEEEGVGLYTIGTETDGLFRTRPTEEWPNDFSRELRAMVAEVREVYTGPLGYDMHYSALTQRDVFGPGSDHLWEDLDLDIIGLSGYFPLADCPPRTALPVETLEERWDKVFQDYLLPLQAANPGRPIYFTEFGYTDSVGSVINAGADMFTQRDITDKDFNGIDDGEEMQQNIHEALFNVMERYPGMLNGLFQWEMWIATEEQWASRMLPLRGLFIRGRLAEDVVREHYGATPRLITPTPIPLLENKSPDIQGLTCIVYEDDLSSVWALDPWSGSAELNSTAMIYEGSNAIEVSLEPNGAITFDNRSFDVSPYDSMVFYLNGGATANQELYVEMKSNDNTSLGKAPLVDYIEDYPLKPGRWHRVEVPLSSPNSDLGSFAWFDIGDASGNGASTFYIDEILFVATEP